MTACGNILLKRKITAPGPNGNPTAQIAIPMQNTPASTIPIPNEQPVQFIQRGNELFEVPEQAENTNPAKCQLLEIRNIPQIQRNQN